MNAQIVSERADSENARALIAELDAILEPLYPRASRHGYSVQKLLAKNVSFFVIYVDRLPAGCGGIEFAGNEYGEVKRMYVRPQFRGMELGRLILEHLENVARARDIPLLRLETGIHQHNAIALYENFGFYRIPPFAEYFEDPNSRCYEKRIGQSFCP